ncbi:MAG: DUF424 domain-containing protein [Salinirussus sp.]
MVLTERETDEGLLVAACDAGLIGKTFENGDVSLTVDEAFYASEAAEHGVSADRVAESLASCVTANLVGSRTVEIAVERGFVDEETVLEIGGTRHAQLVWI